MIGWPTGGMPMAGHRLSMAGANINMTPRATTTGGLE